MTGNRIKGQDVLAVVIVAALVALCLTAASDAEAARGQNDYLIETLTGFETRARESAERIDALESEVASATTALDALREESAAIATERDALAAEVQRISEARKSRPAASSRSVASASVPSGTSGGQADLIRSIAASRGLSESEAAGLVEIARRESTIGANPEAYNSSRECVGLFQLDSDKGTTEQRLDDTWNTNRAIDYIEERYGSVEGAIAHSNAKGWY